MKITFREVSRDDVTRQFRHYLVKLDLPEAAIRFKDAVRKTAAAIGKQPYAAPLIICAIRNFGIFDHGRWPGLKISGFIFWWRTKP